MFYIILTFPNKNMMPKIFLYNKFLISLMTRCSYNLLRGSQYFWVKLGKGSSWWISSGLGTKKSMIKKNTPSYPKQNSFRQNMTQKLRKLTHHDAKYLHHDHKKILLKSVKWKNWQNSKLTKHFRKLQLRTFGSVSTNIRANVTLVKHSTIP